MKVLLLFQNGTLKIIDRKKHIFKLAQGEYIAPEKIENIYIRSDPVAQVFVHGDSLQVRDTHNCQILFFTILHIAMYEEMGEYIICENKPILSLSF